MVGVFVCVSCRSITQHTANRRLGAVFHVLALCVVFGLGVSVVAVRGVIGLGVISGISGGAGERRSEARHVLAPALLVLAVSRASVFLDAEGAARFTVGLTLARPGLAALGVLSLRTVLLALALVRRPCMPRVRPCLALIKLGDRALYADIPFIFS